MNEKKLKALQLLMEKQTDPMIRYSDITEQTGYSKRQLIRLSAELQKKDTDAVLSHGNENRIPANKAASQEIEYLKQLKTSYPNITIAQFKDIFEEDILDNPDRQNDVLQYSLQRRSSSWFRNLFNSEGWISPAKRRPIRKDGRASHLLREPAPQRGMLVQIDGTPFDWFNDGNIYTLHLAVDDATTEALAGWFCPTERQFGYCAMMRILLEKHGIPMALYSDKHSVFRNNGAAENLPTQFAMMMEDLGIECIFASSPEAKGRVERYNGTVQNRLPNDIIRFQVPDYENLNYWLNDFYLPYINCKFAFLPLDPHDAFVPLDEYDISDVFTLRFDRIINNDMFSLNNRYYCVLDDCGTPLHIINGTKINLRIDVFTEEIKVLRYGKKHNVKMLFDRKRKKNQLIDGQKDLFDFLHHFRE